MNPSPLNTTNVLLTQLIQASGGAVPTVPSKTNVWWSQPLAYASLSMSLLATLGAVLGKQWLVNYKSTRSGHGSLEERGLQRQDKLRGLEVWHLDAILQSFPVLLQLSLLIFGIALSGYVWTQEAATSGIVISVTAAGVLFYLFIVIASLHSSNCPFQTPASAILRLAWKRMIPTSLSQGITRRESPKPLYMILASNSIPCRFVLLAAATIQCNTKFLFIIQMFGEESQEGIV